MKRVQIMLTAIALLAIVGGALAFKAQGFGSRVFKRNLIDGKCNVLLPNYTTVPQAFPAERFVGIYTDEQDGVCGITTIYFLL